MRTKPIKAWAIMWGGVELCHHEDSYSIFSTLKEARQNFRDEEGSTHCTGDRIVPVLITPNTPK